MNKDVLAEKENVELRYTISNINIGGEVMYLIDINKKIRKR